MKQNSAFWPALFLALMLIGIRASAGARVTRSGPTMHRVVFDVSGNSPKQWGVMLHNVAALQKTFGRQNTRIEVVAYGPGLDLLLAQDTAQEGALRAAAGTGVVLAACRNTLRARHLTRADLFPFVTTVDSGVAELVRKEQAGWAYIKGG